MPLDIGWAISLSITGIIATVGILSIINFDRCSIINIETNFHKF